MADEANPLYCKTCLNLDFERFKSQNYSDEHDWPHLCDSSCQFHCLTFDSLRSSVAAGCKYCRIIMDGAVWAWGDRPEIHGEESRHDHRRCNNGETRCPFDSLNTISIQVERDQRLFAWRNHPLYMVLSLGVIGDRTQMDISPKSHRPGAEEVDAIEFFTPYGTAELNNSSIRQSHFANETHQGLFSSIPRLVTLPTSQTPWIWKGFRLS
ncbi:hypothetical protein B0T17DRAFT_264236 [Bombardia bombarda]|uniref:Uncharacterized protein n=1 Tax=Bombardia bombarda TaxID=252184 RepID=A0AA39X1C3_9PEZI|nr:hypothetical protein B0T17DRAFT_264236 [Bombardia bombarda]